MRKHLAYLFTTLLALGLHSVAYSQDAEMKEIRNTLNKDFQFMNETLANKKLAEKHKKAALKQRLRERLALGALAEKAIGDLGEGYTFQQTVNFSQEFQEYLVNFSLDRILAYGGAGIEISSITPKGSSQFEVITVGRELKGQKQKRLSLDGRATNTYIVEKIGGEWRIVDLIIGGVNVADNFHSQFKAVLERKDGQTLLKSIRDSNKQNR